VQEGPKTLFLIDQRVQNILDASTHGENRNGCNIKLTKVYTLKATTGNQSILATEIKGSKKRDDKIVLNNS